MENENNEKKFESNLGTIMFHPEGKKFYDGIYSKIMFSLDLFPGTKQEYEEFRGIKCKIVDIASILIEMSKMKALKVDKAVKINQWIRDHLDDILKKEQIKGLESYVQLKDEYELHVKRENFPSKLADRIDKLLLKEHDKIEKTDNHEFYSTYHPPTEAEGLWFKCKQVFLGRPNLEDYDRYITTRGKENLSESIEEYASMFKKQFIDPKVIALIHYNTETEIGVPVAECKNDKRN